ncbi:MAG: DUF721 domain-containing protein [Candidatus Poribacteria bacterium]|nr:DUF721 domain-containing protein [Candidatus Poribacteria bacterium]
MKHKNTESKYVKKLTVKRLRSKSRRGTIRFRSVVDTMVREHGWSDKLFERSVFGVWESVVGKEIAVHCVPVSLFDGVLKVDVAHQMYANELSAMKPEILSGLKKKLEELNLRARRSVQHNKVIDIRFHFNPKIATERNGEDGTKPESSQEPTHDMRKSAKSVSPEMMEQIEAAVSGVRDLELRDALQTLFLTLCGDTETTE